MSVPANTPIDVTIETETPLFGGVVMIPRGSKKKAPETGRR